MVFNFTKTIYGYECDVYGHLNNANYLQIYEAARAEALNDMGMSIKKLKELNISLYVIKVEIEYKKGVELGENLTVKTSVVQHNRLSGLWRQEMYNSSGELCSFANVTGVYVSNGKPVRISKELCSFFDKFVVK